MIITKLSAEETREHQFTHKIAMTFADFVPELSGTAFEIFPKLTQPTLLPIGTRISACAVQVPIIFVAAAMTDLQLVIGDTATPNRIFATKEIGGTTTPIAANTWYDAATTVPCTLIVADSIKCTATVTGGSLAILSAGTLNIFLAIADASKL